ncbi:MAG: AMP-binding protein [Psychrosphaera sp.]|nr:AMP-binding protein [Psychrosphaera sp.]
MFEQQSLSYAQLNQKSNQLAHLLKSQGVKANALVALYLDRSFDMVISILAVLKAGGAYVPVSPLYPSARSQFIFEDTGVLVIISQHKYHQHLTQMQSRAVGVCCDTFDSSLLSKANLALNNTRHSSSHASSHEKATDLAYVIYTSGTTGQPKGVMISHQNTVHLADAQFARFELADCQRVL